MVPPVVEMTASYPPPGDWMPVSLNWSGFQGPGVAFRRRESWNRCETEPLPLIRFSNSAMIEPCVVLVTSIASSARGGVTELAEWFGATAPATSWKAQEKRDSARKSMLWEAS